MGLWKKRSRLVDLIALLQYILQFRTPPNRRIGARTFGNWTRQMTITTASRTSISLCGCVQQRCHRSRSSTGKLDRSTKPYSNGLPKGSYTLEVENSKHIHVVLFILWCLDYPVQGFNGGKSFIISTTAWTGGRNIFLGIAYIVIGSVCLMLGAVFIVIHIKFGHSFAEMANIQTNTR